MDIYFELFIQINQETIQALRDGVILGTVLICVVKQSDRQHVLSFNHHKPRVKMRPVTKMDRNHDNSPICSWLNGTFYSTWRFAHGMSVMHVLNYISRDMGFLTKYALSRSLEKYVAFQGIRPKLISDPNF